MSLKKKIILLVVVIVALTVSLIMFKGKKKQVSFREISPRIGSITVDIKVSGVVSPKNRLEIKPQVSGRIDSILVAEGVSVKVGQIIAWMSSTERAALLDAVRSNDEKELQNWQDTYKPTPVISPINGFIIARYKEPGQTVTPSDVMLVIADTLIVEADVDETDLRYIHLNQKVVFTLDAYPDQKFSGAVDHIAFDSVVVNNVTIYKIKVRPLNVPKDFRSGMSATIDVVAQQSNDVLLLPLDAVISHENRKFVFVKEGRAGKKRVKIDVGISDGKDIEITAGITGQDVVLMQKKQKENTENRRQATPFGMGGRGRR